MKAEATAELAAPLGLLPPVEFCCVYGSSLHRNNNDKSSMVDYILGVSDPIQWHSENLERNRSHYSSLMGYLGPKVITGIADKIGVGMYFNPFVQLKDKVIKYGVVRMQDLALDVLRWDRFYMSGRLQKPVHILVDNYGIRKVNIVNLKAATSVALLLSPPKFTEVEEDLYSKICSLSYLGDLRMLFAEDKNKVKKIVQGSFISFRSMYKPFMEEYAGEGLLKPLSNARQVVFKQDSGILATQCLFSSLPCTVQSLAGLEMGKGNKSSESGAMLPITISSREEAANCTQKVLRRLVRVSSARQAVSGLLTVGGVNAARYLGRKISKAWRSRTS